MRPWQENASGTTSLVPELAKKGLLPAVNIREFWEHAEATGVEWGQAHPAVGPKAHRPMGLYGDDAQFNQHQDKLVIVTLSDILSPETHSMATRWPLFVLRDATCLHAHSQNQAML